jgi:hypothetical protein
MALEASVARNRIVEAISTAGATRFIGVAAEAEEAPSIREASIISAGTGLPATGALIVD